MHFSGDTSTLAIFLRSLQPWTFPASILSVLLGTCLAWKHDKKFNLLKTFLTVCVILLTHTAGNFVNSFHEVRSRKFFASCLTRSRALELNTSWALWSYFFAMLAFTFLAVLSEAEFWLEFVLFSIGFLVSLLHGGKLNNTFLGEILASGVFGPFSVFFTYLEQVGSTDGHLSNPSIIWYSLPFMFFTEAILHSQSTRDIDEDKRAGFRTLAVTVGRHFAYHLQALFLLFPYVVLVLMAATSSPIVYLPLVTLPFALNLSVACFQGEHFMLPKKVAGLHAVFGLLYVLSVFFS